MFPFRDQDAILTSIVKIRTSAMNTSSIARRKDTAVKRVAEQETA